MIKNTLKDIQAHKSMAKSMNIFQLSETIRELIDEYNEMCNFLVSEELQAYIDLIELYSDELGNKTKYVTPCNHRQLLH